ncbi:L-aspartate oxidase [Eubacterium ruminantium]|nr:L-aspartate oxidase [Eubacterium ruminantium]
MKTDILIVGSGCSALYAALNLPRDKEILLITKRDLETNDSHLAQGGMCVLKDESDYESYFEDTMKAGHYENDPVSVEIMIRTSQRVLKDLEAVGAEFARNPDGTLDYTREGGHSGHRIVYHEDITGKEITSHLLAAVKKLKNVTMVEYTKLIDIIEKDNVCYGAVIRKSEETRVTRGGEELTLTEAGFNTETLEKIEADVTILATGGIGGLYRHSTNFRHLTGDALAISINHGIELKDINYVQIHPTTFYSECEEDRSFLISESVRGEGALLYDKNMNRFVNELIPRDLLTAEIRKKMAEEGTKHVWEDMRPLGDQELREHFPNIFAHCEEKGYDPSKQCIPVVPAQHYFMGGIKVNHESKTSMNRLYAVGETANNGVHGRNRLASNSLLESMVFALRAAMDIIKDYSAGVYGSVNLESGINCESELRRKIIDDVNLSVYADDDAITKKYRELVMEEIQKADSAASDFKDEEEYARIKKEKEEAKVKVKGRNEKASE